MNSRDLIIFTDEDGMPWAAFAWGNVSADIVAALITPEAIEEATGFSDANLRTDEISWPPRVQHYWLRAADGDDEQYVFCAADHPDAQLITGHRFYPR